MIASGFSAGTERAELPDFTFKWLGVAGIELNKDGIILTVDPYLTRFPDWWWKLSFGTLRSDPEAVHTYLPCCNYILVSHAHWDHCLDVAEIVKSTQAAAFGSENVYRLLQASGLTISHINRIHDRDVLNLQGFDVEVLSARHPGTAGFGREWAKGAIKKVVSQPPRRAKDYRMDNHYGFLIRVGDLKILHWCGIGSPNVKADILVTPPYHYKSHEYYSALLHSTQPEILIPVHWEHTTHPVARGTKPAFGTIGTGMPLFQKIDMHKFADMIRTVRPETRVFLPEMFRTYSYSHQRQTNCVSL